MQIFYQVQTILVEMRKILGEKADDIARAMRSVIDYNVKPSAMCQDRLPCFFCIGVSHDHGNSRAVIFEVGTAWIDIASHEFFGIWEKLIPKFQRAAVLNAEFLKTNGLVAIRRQQFVVLIEVEGPFIR